MERTYASDIANIGGGKTVKLIGWVHEIRDLGGIKFILLRDKSGICQITIKKKNVKKEVLEKIEKIRLEYVISIKGIVSINDKVKGGAEVLLEDIDIISEAKQPLPYDIVGKVKANLDTRLNYRVLDLRKLENRAIFIIGNVALNEVRNFLIKEGFIEIRTPRIISTATEGGAALFTINYFNKIAFLAQSPQLYKEELTTVFEKVFEIGPFFRAEESHTTRHISEFTSIDIETAFHTKEDVMELLERMIKEVIDKVSQKCKEELKILNINLEPIELPILRITYDEAISKIQEANIKINWGEDFSIEHLRYLGKIYPTWYFIIDFPTISKPFYIQPNPLNEKLCESFDLMYKWIEIASGGQRISNKDLLISRLKEQKLNPESFKHHLEIYDYGMPPHSGWAVGFERLLMVLTGKRNIREVCLFPRDKFRLIP
ncbi:MAG: aspartate--tRNA(Asn) ligase [Nitrososphaerota archaeon]